MPTDGPDASGPTGQALSGPTPATGEHPCGPRRECHPFSGVAARVREYSEPARSMADDPEPARSMADDRHAFLETFYERFQAEWNGET